MRRNSGRDDLREASAKFEATWEPKVKAAREAADKLRTEALTIRDSTSRESPEFKAAWAAYWNAETQVEKLNTQRYRERAAMFRELKESKRAASKAAKAEKLASAHAAGAMGTCQVCFRLLTTPNGKLSLHGFERPGDGELHGRCRGQRELPYEESCDVTREYAQLLRNEQARLQDVLAKYERGEVTEVSVLLVRRDPRYPRARIDEPKNFTLKLGDARVPNAWGTATLPSFDERIADIKSNLKAKLAALAHDIPYYDAKVAEWKPVQRGGNAA